MKKRILLLAMLVVVIFAFSGCGNKGVVLNVYNWGDYIDETVLDDFEEEYGIKVNYEMFATNEDMYTKIKQGGTQYDVIFPSDYMIEKMKNEDLLEMIDMSKITNYGNIGDQFKGLDYDADNQYSVPYFWGTVGILYNKTMVDEPVDSWDILWDNKYKDQILMYDSQRDTLAVALKKLGYSLNTRDLNELEEAKQLLIDQKPLVYAYVGDNVKDMMIGEEAALAIVWSGEATATIWENENLEYAIPKEGSNLWFDAMAIPKGSEHIEEAQLFIDFMTRPDIAFRNADYVGYSTPNLEALKQIDEETKAMLSVNPDLSKLSNMEVFHDPADFIEEYNRVWTEFKAHE